MVKGPVGTPMNDVGSKLINFDIKVPCFALPCTAFVICL